MIAKLTIKTIDAIEMIKRGFQDDEGAALVEYGLLVGLIAVLCVAAVATLGTTVKGYFTAINTALSAA